MLRADKCELGRSEVHYLGHVISGGMIHPDPEKLHTVKDYPRPEKKRDIRVFLVLVGCHCQFVPKFSTDRFNQDREARVISVGQDV